jgi:ankyrin repeat protein
MVKLLLDNGADVNLGPRIPPIVAAVMAQCPKSVQMLLDKGVDINAVTFDNITPLAQALIQKTHHMDAMLDVLLPHNPDPNVVPTNKVLLPPLFAAMTHFDGSDSWKRIFTLPNINIRLKARHPPVNVLQHLLHETVGTHIKDRVEALINAGFDLNEPDHNGETCLSIMLRKNLYNPQSTILPWLVEKYADKIDFLATNSAGRLASQQAREQAYYMANWKSFIEVLEQHERAQRKRQRTRSAK